MTEAVKEKEKKETRAPGGATGAVERTRPRKVFDADVDIIERGEDVVVIADVPGVDEKSVDVTLEKNILSIYGRVDGGTPEGRILKYAEYDAGDYRREFALTDEVDRGRIRATVKNGVLRLVLPKAEAARTKKIAVTAE